MYVCMYVCMYDSVCICMHAHMLMCVCVHVYVYIMYVYIMCKCMFMGLHSAPPLEWRERLHCVPRLLLPVLSLGTGL